MKDFYTAPEAELLRFAPAENLADLEDGMLSDSDYNGDRP